MSRKPPQYSHHKASGRAFIFVDGKRIYLGPHGSEESHRRYAAELAKWQAAQSDPVSDISVGQLTVLYFGHAQKHYQKNGGPTSKLHVIQMAIRALNRECRNLPASEITPRKFKAVRRWRENRGRNMHCPSPIGLLLISNRKPTPPTPKPRRPKNIIPAEL